MRKPLRLPRPLMKLITLALLHFVGTSMVQTALQGHSGWNGKKKKTVGFYRLWNTAAMIKNKSNSLQEVKVTEDVCLLHHCQKCYRSPFDVKLWHQVGLTKAKSVNLHPYENERQKKRNTRAWGQKENCHDSSTTVLSHIQSKSNRVMSCSHTLEEP